MDDFIAAYQNAVYSFIDDDDKKAHAIKFSAEALSEIQETCTQFQTENANLLNEAYHSSSFGYTPSQAGYDLWLTRNGHGSGFWDRDLDNPIFDALSDRAIALGESYSYIGDDGLVYLSTARNQVDYSTDFYNQSL